MSERVYETFSISLGPYCNASCPFCITQMTMSPEMRESLKTEKIDLENFEIAKFIARNSNIENIIFTGRGEPTLYSHMITEFLENLQDYGSPLPKGKPVIDLQTNGLLFHNKEFKKEGHLEKWHDLGLRVVAVSIVDVINEKNQKIYTPKREYPPLEETVELLHNHGYSVRLSVTMIKGGIDSPEGIDRLYNYSQKYGIEQTSVRPVRMPSSTYNEKVTKWVKENKLDERFWKNQLRKIVRYISKEGTPLFRFSHGAVIYDWHGQNICLTDCLTLPKGEKVRQLIFYPNGQISYDWQYPGAVIIGPGKSYRKNESRRNSNNPKQDKA